MADRCSALSHASAELLVIISKDLPQHDSNNVLAMSTRPSIPPGKVNRALASGWVKTGCAHLCRVEGNTTSTSLQLGLKLGVLTCVEWKVTLCDPI